MDSLWLLLFFVFLLLSDVTAADRTACGCVQKAGPCEGLYGLVDYRCYSLIDPCVYNDNARDVMRDALLENVLGQNRSIHHIYAALSRLAPAPGMKRTTGGALALHFAGDNGVGKTLAAHTIAESLFVQNHGKHVNEQQTTLIIQGERYHHHKLDQDDDRWGGKMNRDVTRMLFKQFKNCPHSVVIINDFQMISRAIYTVIRIAISDGFIDFNGERANCHEGLFIFTSDFGAEDAHRGFKYAELHNMVTDRFGDNWLPDTSIVYDITHIPFVSLEAPTAEILVWKKLKETFLCDQKVACLTVTESSFKHLMARWDQEGKNQNGRGVEFVINREVGTLPKPNIGCNVTISTFWENLKIESDCKNKEDL